MRNYVKHVYTVQQYFCRLGSDCTSSFYGKGKKKAWKTLTSCPQFIESFSLLGQTFPPSDRLISELSRFVCLLYGDAASVDVNICGYNLFKLGKCSDDLLPPTYDSLVKHIERVSYQSAIWSRCLLPNPIIPSPIGNGWRLSNGELEVVWMTRPPAPDSLLDCVNCKCKTGCQTQRCSCNKANLNCTELCSCCDCCNVPEIGGKEGISDVSGEMSSSDEDSCDEFC